MEKFFYLIANDAITIKDKNKENYVFSYNYNSNAVKFIIEREGQDSINYQFRIQRKAELEELKKLLALPEIRKYIDKNYKYQIELDQAQKRYLQDLTRVLSTKNLSNKDKFLIQAAAITAQSYPYNVDYKQLDVGLRLNEDVISFGFIEKNCQNPAQMILFKHGKILNLTPTQFIDFIQENLLNYDKPTFLPKDLKWWYNIYSSSNKRRQKDFNKIIKTLSKSQTKPLKHKSRMSKQTQKLAEARKTLIKARSDLPRDFRLDDPPSKRRRPRKNTVNAQNNQQHNIEIENEK